VMVDLQIKKYSWIWLSILLMWLLKLSEVVFEINLAFLGIAPREFKTLTGIVTVFFIHGDFAHILSNTSSFLILSIMLVYSYPKIAFRLFILITVITGLLVWLFARGGTYHIGASGVVYGIAAFLFFSGFLEKINFQWLFL
jgi:membrane associated rhomboid family serine protease